MKRDMWLQERRCLLVAKVGALAAVAASGVLFWPHPAEAAPACVLRGQASFSHVEPVTVRPHGGDPFTINLADVPLVVTLLHQARRPAVVQVDGPISFRAEHRNLWLQLTRDVRTRDGLVRLRRGVWLANARAVDGGDVIAHAVLDPDDVSIDSSGEPAEVVTDVRVPCSALAVRLADAADLDLWEDGADVGADESLQLYQPVGESGRLLLRVRPEEGAFARSIRSPSCPDCAAVTVLRREGEWRLVERKAWGVSARGWVRRKELRAIDMDTYGIGERCCSRGPGTVYLGGYDGDRRPGYRGPATVRAGARVFPHAGDHAWGVFTRDTEVEVRHVEGEPGVMLRRVPGIAADPPGTPFLDAYVRLEDVEFRPAAPTAPTRAAPEEATQKKNKPRSGTR